MDIHAWAVQSPGGQLKKFTYQKEVGEREVLVEIKYCSLARKDVHLIDNDGGDSHFPLVAGHEIVGMVERVGKKVSEFKPGERVGIGCQQSACFQCDYCLSGQEHLCCQPEMVGTHSYGGFANRIITDQRFVFRIPEDLVSETTAPLLCSGLTVFAGIKKAGLSDQSRTGVIGIGGLGHLAIQILSALGHTVTAFSHTPAKESLARTLGVQDFWLTTPPRNFFRLEKKYDFLISTLPVRCELDFYLNLLKANGSFCLVGFPSTEMNFSPSLLLNKASRTVYGQYLGSRSEMKELLSLAVEKNIQSVIEMVPMGQINQAVERVKRGAVNMRVILKN